MGAKRKNKEAPAKEAAAESVEDITNDEAGTGETGDVDGDTADNADVEEVIAEEAVVYPYQVAEGKSIVHKKKCLASGSEVKAEWFSSDQLKDLVKAGLVDKA